MGRPEGAPAFYFALVETIDARGAGFQWELSHALLAEPMKCLLVRLNACRLRV